MIRQCIARIDATSRSLLLATEVPDQRSSGHLLEGDILGPEPKAVRLGHSLEGCLLRTKEDQRPGHLGRLVQGPLLCLRKDPSGDPGREYAVTRLDVDADAQEILRACSHRHAHAGGMADRSNDADGPYRLSLRTDRDRLRVDTKTSKRASSRESAEREIGPSLCGGRRIQPRELGNAQRMFVQLADQACPDADTGRDYLRQSSWSQHLPSLSGGPRTTRVDTQ